ncbi:MAG: TraR/DksA C4-type zinc finger protein, partial [Pseudonocardia sp.]|nr:TraR/DksA C4-type zinc finger protein [Pseudonocardia sp.]
LRERVYARIAAGTYGRCAPCGAAISPARLDALPAADTCITCASTRRHPRSSR